jgi:hypothetical protein
MGWFSSVTNFVGHTADSFKHTVTNAVNHVESSAANTASSVVHSAIAVPVAVYHEAISAGTATAHALNTAVTGAANAGHQVFLTGESVGSTVVQTIEAGAQGALGAGRELGIPEILKGIGTGLAADVNIPGTLNESTGIFGGLSTGLLVGLGAAVFLALKK